MKRRQDTIQQIIEYLLAPTALVAKDGHILYANQAFASIAQTSRLQIAGEPLHRFLQDDEHNSLTNCLRTLSAKTSPQTSGDFTFASASDAAAIVTRFVWIQSDTILVTLKPIASSTPSTGDNRHKATGLPPLPRHQEIPNSQVPPPPPGEDWRQKAELWESRYQRVAKLLQEQTAVLKQAQDEQKNQTQRPNTSSRSTLDLNALLQCMSADLTNFQRHTQLIGYVNDCEEVLSLLHGALHASSQDKLALFDRHIATFQQLSDDKQISFLTPALQSMLASLNDLKQGRHTTETFTQHFQLLLQDIEKNLLAIKTFLQQITPKKASPQDHWLSYVEQFRRELTGGQPGGKTIAMSINSSHALLGKDQSFFDRIAKAFCKRSRTAIEDSSHSGGHIHIEIERRGSYYIAQISDDGLPLPLEDLYSYAIKQKVIKAHNLPLNPEKLVEFLLHPQIKSRVAKHVPDLAALKKEIEKQSGFLRIETPHDGAGTRFVFDWIAREQTEMPVETSAA